MASTIAPIKTHDSLMDEAFRGLANKTNTVYDCDEYDSGIVTNQSLKNRVGSALFLRVPIGNHVVIRVNQPGVKVRFNTSTDPEITIDPGIPFENSHWLEVRDIFLTTTQATTRVRVIVS